MLTDDRTISPYLKVTNLTVEHWNPTDRFIGVGTDSPRLSWCIEANGQNESVTQQAAAIEITDDKGLTQQFVVEGQCHTLVKWPGRRLVSRDVVYIRVSVYDGTSWSVWSDRVVVEAGLFRVSDWVASFVAPVGIGVMGESAPLLFRSFAVPVVVRRARLYVTAHGVYQVMVNGRVVTDSVLNPGWTGDIQVFSPTALYVYDVSGLLVSWLKDVAVEQYADGGIPLVVPEPDAVQKDPTACAWGDAVIIVPWNVYLATGDVQVLERQLSSMVAWMDHVVSLVGPSRLWRGGFQFGDWLDPTAPADKPWQAKADRDVVATACFARCARVLAQACRVVGDMVSADRYDHLAREVCVAFRDAFVDTDGRIQSDAQTVYAVAIHWGLLTVDQRQWAGERLAQLVDEADYRIATGFIGTPVICDALSETGYADVAWRLLNQRECPSWLYPVTMGATTMWERWDSMLSDGRINPGEMTSFNHYALGSVADWMVRTIAGLSLAAPGWRSVLIRPQYCDRLDHASASHLSPYGMIGTSWTREGTTVSVSATIPEGVDVTVILPDGTTHTAGPGTHLWHANMRDTDISPIRQQ